ncbi:bifunctional pyr operon transcriptional regulator/uracil phosphoribosyltransferase PyrR [bacterium]|nr:bifunctional pyr operon transcriptional regulator/uracil phosphoribosyltransferase PyrR [bacterium]
MKFKTKETLLDSLGFARTISRLAHEILEVNKGSQNLIFVGMRSRGEFVAKRIAKKIEEIENQKIPVGVLDVTLYRDDFRTNLKQPEIRVSDLPLIIDEKNIILVDDVLFTGRTVRAALDALMDYGRPSRIQLVILVDRGHRELPVQADFIGKKVITSKGQEVRVKIKEFDKEEDAVYLVELEEN